MDRATLLDLPVVDVIISYVFPFLTTKDLFSLRGVNTELMDLVQVYFDTYLEHLKFMNRFYRIPASTFIIMTKNATKLKSITLHNCDWLTSDMLKLVIATNQSMEHIDLTGCTAVKSHVFVHLTENNFSLKTLILNGCHWVTNRAITALSIKLKSLENLDLTSCWDVDDNSLCQLIYSNTRLKCISLGSMYKLTNRTLFVIAKRCPNLENLSIVGCWRVNDDGIRLVGEYCQRLMVFDVDKCHEVSAVSWRRFQDQLKINCYPLSFKPALLFGKSNLVQTDILKKM